MILIILIDGTEHGSINLTGAENKPLTYSKVEITMTPTHYPSSNSTEFKGLNCLRRREFSFVSE